MRRFITHGGMCDTRQPPGADSQDAVVGINLLEKATTMPTSCRGSASLQPAPKTRLPVRLMCLRGPQVAPQPATGWCSEVRPP